MSRPKIGLQLYTTIPIAIGIFYPLNYGSGWVKTVVTELILSIIYPYKKNKFVEILLSKNIAWKI